MRRLRRRFAPHCVQPAFQVFFDQSELRGGDVWDQKIRREIHDCALFIPIISTNTAARHEGYFRLEWDLADQRTHMIARSRVFVVPVCLDATTQAAADVPESFQRAQWTLLPGGETPPAFVERINRLLSPELSPLSAVSGAVAPIREPVRVAWRSRWALLGTVAVVVIALGYLAVNRLMLSKRGAEMRAAPAAHNAPETPFNPPPHSIAVLPFVNMSGDPDPGVFLRWNDGGAPEFTRADQRAAGRCPHLRFLVQRQRQRHRDRCTQTKCECSARRERTALFDSTIRVTAQLINAVTGFHLWSQTYDRDLGESVEAANRHCDLRWRTPSK